MKKHDELANAQSCWNRARFDERLFVLLARDPAAPATIRFWVGERITSGKNKATDPQIVEALECADAMEKEAARVDPA